MNIITLILNDGEYRTTSYILNSSKYFKSILENAKNKKEIFVDFTMKEIKFMMDLIKYGEIPKYSEYIKYKYVLDHCSIKTKSREIFKCKSPKYGTWIQFKENGKISQLLGDFCGTTLYALKNANMHQLEKKYPEFELLVEWEGEETYTYNKNGNTKSIYLQKALKSINLIVKKNIEIKMREGDYIEVIYDTDI